MGVYLDIVRQFESEASKNELNEVNEGSRRGEAVNSLSSFNSYSDNVIFGPWYPTTPEQIAEERRRVLEEDPPRWWWRPRYRLAELERAGMSRGEAVALIRADERKEN